MWQLDCKALTVGYEGNIILENLSFQVNQGDYLCIIGGNGTGKTTLMKTILGLKRQISGDVLWGDGVLPSDVGYLTQQSEIQREFPASVSEVVLSGFQSQCGIRPFYKKEEKIRGKSIMRNLGIQELERKCYGELSGGQQQRVLLARALCATKKILFLDEPVTGLDPEVSAQMYGIVEKLNKEEGITIVMISHDVETASQYATHILQIGSSPYYGKREGYLNDCHTCNRNGLEKRSEGYA